MARTSAAASFEAISASSRARAGSTEMRWSAAARSEAASRPLPEEATVAVPRTADRGPQPWISSLERRQALRGDAEAQESGLAGAVVAGQEELHQQVLELRHGPGRALEIAVRVVGERPVLLGDGEVEVVRAA